MTANLPPANVHGDKLAKPVLSPEHARLIAESGISDDVRDERGYFTAYTKARLTELGFGRNVGVPALVIPVYSTTGELVTYQVRPDMPRMRGGRPVKYETVPGSRMHLDVPRRVKGILGHPKVPLFVTEGARKADAAVSHRMVCIALLGVWNWRGRNAEGGLTALGDWESVALRDRIVYVVFDSDVMAKVGVHQALSRLGAFLRGRGADVRFVYLPSEPAGGKVGLDDYLAAGGGVDDLVHRSTLEPLSPPASPIVAAHHAVKNPGPPPAPWESVKTAALLDDIVAMFSKYVSFPSDCARDAVALWVAHTHVVDAFDSTPRLHLSSPEKATGKTRTLEIAAILTARAHLWLNASPAAMFRLIAESQPTLLIDEIDAVFGPRAAYHEDLRALLNGGHRRGATVPRMVGEGANMRLQEFPTYAAVMMAGIGDLPDTITSRSIVVHMRRRAPTERIEPFRIRAAEGEAAPLRERLSEWGEAHVDLLRDANPDMPPGVSDRAADVWEPLFAIADLAGDLWARRARDAAVALVTAGAEDETSWGIRLLRDILDVFDANPTAERIASEDLATRLAEMEEAPWGGIRGMALTPSGLARRLRPFGIRPDSVRFGDKTLKGYHRLQFEDPWRRYLTSSLASRNTGTGGADAAGNPPFRNGVPDVPVNRGQETMRVSSLNGFDPGPSPANDSGDGRDAHPAARAGGVSEELHRLLDNLQDEGAEVDAAGHVMRWPPSIRPSERLVWLERLRLLREGKREAT